ncbi:unnamed protein product [Closterium sp. NIES-53]
MYLMTCTRPDLAYPLSLLARYVAPGRHRKVHWDAAKRVLQYLCSISGMGLVLGGRARVVLTGHADASWVDDLATQRSSQGYTFSLGSGSVSWRSTCSSSVLSSSCEAEIYAGAMAAQELRWLTYLLTDLGEVPRSPPVLYVENKAMLALCQEHKLEHRTKHIALRYFLARELQQRGQLRLAYVASQANTADVFTKALQPCDHQPCFAFLDWSCDLLFSPTLPLGCFEAVQVYALLHKLGYKVMICKENYVVVGCKAMAEGLKPLCLWSCSYSQCKRGDFWCITGLVPMEEHICKPEKRHEYAVGIANKLPVLIRAYGNMVRADPFVAPIHLMRLMEGIVGQEIHHWQAWRLREHIMKEMYGAWKESFCQIPWLVDRFKFIDPKVKVHLDTLGGLFHRFFVRPSAAHHALNFCRPVVAFVETHLISAHKAVLLVAVTLDGDQKVLLLAWGLVESENKESWSWFLRHFLDGFPEWVRRKHVAMISNRDKGLVPAAREVIPSNIPHYFCA